MEVTYRVKTQEISIAFLNALKEDFAGQEVEITVKTLEPVSKKRMTNSQKKNLLKLFEHARLNAPVIDADIDIRKLIDESQYPELSNDLS